jgi:hypothetical protein
MIPRFDSVAKLRVGVMLDDWRVEGWIAEVLQDVQGSGFARVTTVILNNEPAVTPPRLRSRFRSLSSLRSAARFLLWGLYVKADSRRHSKRTSLFSLVSVRELLSGASTIEVNPGRKGAVHTFAEQDIQRVRSDRLDVILRFGFNILRGDVLASAKHGVWSYHHGDNRFYRGSPPAFWEMYEKNAQLGAILQILTEELDGGRVIGRVNLSTPSFSSLAVNREAQYRAAIPLVIRSLERLHAGGELPVEPQSAYGKALYRKPRNTTMAKFVASRITHQLSSWLRF